VKGLQPAPSSHHSPFTSFVSFVNSLPLAVALSFAALVLLALALAARGFFYARHSRKREVQLQADIGDLQMALLADVPARVGPLATSAAYRPASGPGAGGDFFDVFELADKRVIALIGDVSGHGQRALAQTAFIHYGLRAWLQDGFEPRQALKRASEALTSDLEASFVTVLICVYSHEDATLTWAAAGHPPPLFAGAKPVFTKVVVSPPVGMGMLSGQRQTVVSLPQDVLVCLHTDGLNEAVTKDGGRLGEVELERLLHLCNDEVCSAEELLNHVAAAADTTRDDMAAVLLRVEGVSQATLCQTLSEELEVTVDDDLALVRDFVLAAGLSDTEAARAVAELEIARTPERPALVKVFSQTQTFVVQGNALTENHVGPRRQR
jgi:hypothetical protein